MKYSGRLCEGQTRASIALQVGDFSIAVEVLIVLNLQTLMASGSEQTLETKHSVPKGSRKNSKRNKKKRVLTL